MEVGNIPASLYDEYDLERQNIVDAKYISAILEEDKGNPYIESLPFPRSKNEVDSNFYEGLLCYDYSKVLIGLENVAITKMSLESVFRIWVTTVILQRMRRFLM